MPLSPELACLGHVALPLLMDAVSFREDVLADEVVVVTRSGKLTLNYEVVPAFTIVRLT
jgi:hypothetical protein